MAYHVNKCIKCKKQNLKPRKYATIHYLTARRPFDGINIDLIGEHNLPSQRNRVPLTAIDQLWGFIMVSIIHDKMIDSVSPGSPQITGINLRNA